MSALMDGSMQIADPQLNGHGEKEMCQCATVCTAENLWYVLYVSYSITLSLSPQ